MAHLYWRIDVTANDGNTAELSIPEIEFRSAVGGPNAATGGTVTVPSRFSASYDGPQALDGDNETWWACLDPVGWLQYQFTSAVDIVEISLGAFGPNSASGRLSRLPRDFTIQWSDDGTTWTTAWSVAGQTNWAVSEVRTFSAPSSAETQASKLVAYAVMDYPEAKVAASKLTAYAVMDFPEAKVGASKVTAYAVMDFPDSKVGASKLTAYAVMDEAVNTPDPPPSEPAPKVGDTLGYEGDTWDNNPTSFIHQWYRDGTPISGAGNPTYTLVQADVGSMVKQSLIGVNEFGQSDPVLSNAVGPVEAAGFVAEYLLGRRDCFFDINGLDSLYQDLDQGVAVTAAGDLIGSINKISA